VLVEVDVLIRDAEAVEVAPCHLADAAPAAPVAVSGTSVVERARVKAVETAITTPAPPAARRGLEQLVDVRDVMHVRRDVAEADHAVGSIT
jgi:hypothetical protein